MDHGVREIGLIRGRLKWRCCSIRKTRPCEDWLRLYRRRVGGATARSDADWMKDAGYRRIQTQWRLPCAVADCFAVAIRRIILQRFP